MRRAGRCARQRGLGFLGYLMVIAALFAAGTFAVRVAPPYLEHRTLDQIVRSALEEEGLERMTAGGFRQRLDRQLTIDGLRDLPLRDMVEFDRDPKGVEVVVDYEVRRPLFANAELVLTFHEEYARSF